MWTYKQSTGELLDHSLVTIATGYAGHDGGKNNPDMQEHPNMGPLPRGKYDIQGPPVDTKEHGPYVLHLVPHKENQMFGRSGFLIHGDSVKKPGSASLGCMIMPRDIRETIWKSGDHLLEVVL
jgi:hypothetical protein